MQRCPITAVFQAQGLLEKMESILFKTKPQKNVDFTYNFLDFVDFGL
jgi:hypothetical protein